MNRSDAAADAAFLDAVREDWRIALTARLGDAARADALCDTVEQFLRTAGQAHGIGALDLWRALLDGHATAAAIAVFSGGTDG